MAFLDEREDAPHPGKRGDLLRQREDPDLGKNPGPGPLGGGERHPPHPHGEGRGRGHHDDSQEQPAAVRHRPRRHAGGLCRHHCRPQPGAPRPGVRHPGEHRELPAAGGGAYLFCRATPVQVGGRICVVSVEQRNDRDELITTAPVYLRGGQEDGPHLPAPQTPRADVFKADSAGAAMPPPASPPGGKRGLRVFQFLEIPVLELVLHLAGAAGAGAAEGLLLGLRPGRDSVYTAGDSLQIGHHQAHHGEGGQEHGDEFEDRTCQFHRKTSQIQLRGNRGLW